MLVDRPRRADPTIADVARILAVGFLRLTESLRRSGVSWPHTGSNCLDVAGQESHCCERETQLGRPRWKPACSVKSSASGR